MYVWCRGITYDRLRETIAVDLAEELGFLDLFDRALRGIQQVVDLPDRQARDLARFVLQDDGRLSARKRARFAELTGRRDRRLRVRGAGRPHRGGR